MARFLTDSPKQSERRQGGCLYDSAVFWQREDDDEGPRGWVVVVGGTFAHLISSASFHYVIMASVVAPGSWWTYVLH